MSNYTVYGVDDENQRITVTDDLTSNITILELSTIELGQLADVDINNLQASQVIAYNSIAGRWQNIDQGASQPGVSPTVVIGASQFQFGDTSFSISNYNTYTLPNFKFEIKDSGGNVVLNTSNVTHNGSGNFSFATGSLTPGNFTLETTAQDFGEAESATVSNAFSVSAVTFRYYRIHGFDGDPTTTSIMLGDFALFTDSSQGGTKLPTNMTSNTAPSPFVASGTGSFSAIYDYFKVFDSNTLSTFYWNLAGNNATNYIDLDLGSSTTVKSARITQANNVSYTFGSLTLSGSDTGAFSGEETQISVISTVKQAAEVTNVG